MDQISNIKGMHEYQVDCNRQLVVRDDGKSIGCYAAASKVHQFINTSKFTKKEWLFFFFVDLLAYLPFLKRFQFKILKSKLIPDLSKKVDEVNKFIEKYYRCPFSTVKWLEDARVQCLGETHISLGHREANAKLVDIFSTPTGFLRGRFFGSGNVLLEEYENEKKPSKTPLQLNYAPSNCSMLFEGWDKLNHDVAYGLASLTTALAGISISSYFTKDINSEVFHYLAKSGVFIPTSLISLYFFSRVLYGVIPRNRHMFKQIQAHSKAKKIFVVGGSGHFEPEKFYPGSKAIVSEMHEFLGKHRSAILIPKRKTFFYAPLKSIEWAKVLQVGACAAMLVTMWYTIPSAKSLNITEF